MQSLLLESLICLLPKFAGFEKVRVYFCGAAVTVKRLINCPWSGLTGLNQLTSISCTRDCMSAPSFQIQIQIQIY